MKLKKQIFILYVLLLIVVSWMFAGCSNTANIQKNDSIIVSDRSDSPIQDSKDVKSGDGSVDDNAFTRVPAVAEERGDADHAYSVISYADFLMNYNSVDVLTDQSSLVVEGIIQNEELFLHQAFSSDIIPYTIYDVRILGCRKGDIEPDSVIRVAAYGGFLTAEQAGFGMKFPNMTPQELENPVQFSFGTEPLEIGQQVLLYLSNDSGYQILKMEDAYYMLVGEYHGVFFRNQDGFYEQTLPKKEQSNQVPLIIS